MANVTLTNVTKVYPEKRGGKAALDGLNIEIQDRDFVVLTGPPQSGLSAIIRTIAGLDNVSTGDVLIGNRRVNDLSPNNRDVAVVFQNQQPYPAMSVYENLAFCLKHRKFSPAEIKKRVHSGAEALGLTSALDQKGKSLSAEQRQRLAIARATALQPGVILFDEPLANLNRDARVRLREEIGKLHQRLRATMIYTTHDSTEAMAIGNRIVLLRNGVVQQDGSGRSLYEEPNNVFVAEFFGNPPMNLIQGHLKQDRDGYIFSEAEEGTIKLRLPIAQPAAEQVLLGIRPNEIRVAQSISNKMEKPAGRFPAIIDRVENGDGQANLYLYTGSNTLVCRADWESRGWEAGHRLEFELTLSKVCLFDAISGVSLASGV